MKIKLLFAFALLLSVYQAKAQNLEGKQYLCERNIESRVVLNFISADTVIIENYVVSIRDKPKLIRMSSIKMLYKIKGKNILLGKLATLDSINPTLQSLESYQEYSSFEIKENGNLEGLKYFAPNSSASHIFVIFSKFKGYKKEEYQTWEEALEKARKETKKPLSKRKQAKHDKIKGLLSQTWRGAYCGNNDEPSSFMAINGDFQIYLQIKGDTIVKSEFGINDRNWASYSGTCSLDNDNNIQIHFTSKGKPTNLDGYYIYDKTKFETKIIDVTRTYKIEKITEHELIITPLNPTEEYGKSCYVR